MSSDDVFETTPDGEMLLAGHRVTDLLRRFGSPLVVLLEEVVRKNCREYRQKAARYPRSRVYYAGKAFLCTGFCRLIREEGLGLDVVSGGELLTALAAGFPAEAILMHGNAKTREELALALEAGVGRIVIDNLDEIALLGDLCREHAREAQVLIRVTPGIEPHTHRYVQTGQVDSKFGFNLVGGLAEEAVRRTVATPGLRLVGLHCHIGSQIFEFEPYELAARAMMRFYAHVVRDLGIPLSELNMGGGLAIRYGSDDPLPSIPRHVESLARVVEACALELGVDPPVLCDEPGRSIVAKAGVTLYTVQSTKRIPMVRNYVAVDGGMSDNPRHALYGARHRVVAATRLHQPADVLWSVSGRCCESGDMLARDVLLPDVVRGDVLAVLDTGAYTYSMASNYNRVARPAVVLVGQGRAGLLIERERPDDLVRLDRIPEWLATV